jgi:hypothetical protein
MPLKESLFHWKDQALVYFESDCPAQNQIQEQPRLFGPKGILVLPDNLNIE